MGLPKTSLKVLVEETPEQATALAGELVKTIMCDAVSERGACHIALAGGTTPHLLYQQLATSCASGEVPWGQVQVFFGDERDVPHDHVESNYHMAQKTLLDHVPVEPSAVHPMPADSTDLPQAAADYEQSIRRIVPGEPPRFDLVLLGLGADGHTASLFPGTDAVAETSKLVTSNFVPVLGRHRMTFTFPLINAARCVILLVTGEDKADAVAALLGDDEAARKDLPAARLTLDANFILVLDAAAARRTNLRV